MEQIEKHNRKVNVVTDVYCDCCGKSCKVGEGVVDNSAREDHGEEYYLFEFLKLEAFWGYNSNKDMQHWTAQVCEKCVDEKFSFINFKISKTQYRTK